MNYRTLTEHEITLELFSQFQRRQNVTLCYRREGNSWVIRPDPFVDDWGPEEYRFLTVCLRNTVSTGGVVYGAFAGDGALKGFVSVESEPMGQNRDYLDLTSIHVSEELRGQGAGKTLFRLAADWARTRGATKLYISSHSALETQKFYRNLGCVDAKEFCRSHVEQEPFDCQLEYVLGQEE